MKKSVALIVAILAIPVLFALAVVAVRKGADGATLIVIEVAVGAWLALSAIATALAAAREPQLSRFTTLVLLVACAFAAAIGRHPGLFASVGEALVVILLIAAAATAIIGRMRGRDAARFAFWTTFFAAAVTAAWQVGVEPLLASILVRW